MSINKFLGIDQSTKQVQFYIRSYLLLQLLLSFVFSLSGTFYILYAIDNIGFTAAAVMVSIMLFSQLLFDYPSGSLGDWIGQRWILFLALISYSFGYYMLSISGTSVSSFMLIGFIMGFANAQFSGTLTSWIDNNYQIIMGAKDPERKEYGFSMSRVATLNNIALVLAFLLGGTLATLISRKFVFSIQVVLSILVTFIILKRVKDVKIDIAIGNEDIGSVNNYITYLTGGIAFLFSSKITFFFLIGLAIYNVTWYIWGNLILFPLYFGYSGSDGGASILRTIIFIIGIPIGIYIADMSKTLNKKKFPILVLIHWFVFFPGYILLTTIIPIENSFNLLGFIFTIIFQNSLISFVLRLSDILRQRIMLDLIPSNRRNSVYSLIPSIVSIIGIPILPISGFIIETFGLTAGIAAAGIVCLIGTSSLLLSIHFMKSSEIATKLKTDPSALTSLGVN